jgi:hypothetical protein
MKSGPLLAVAVCLGLLPAEGVAGQNNDAECAAIATKQTGYAPGQPPPPQAVPNQQVTGSGARVRGAAAGAVIGGVSGGDAGDAAVAGAVAGGVAHRSRARRTARAQNEASSQQYAAAQTAWQQAKAACLAGRGQ